MTALAIGTLAPLSAGPWVRLFLSPHSSSLPPDRRHDLSRRARENDLLALAAVGGWIGLDWVKELLGW